MRSIYAALSVAALIGSDAHAACPGVPADCQNIIIINADDLSSEAISAYGSGLGGLASTPNIDTIATDGVKFTNAWHVTPVCTPSRVMLWTGMGPWQTHVYQNEALVDTFPTVMDSLQAAGYVTAVFGKWQVPPISPTTEIGRNLGFSYRSLCTASECGAYADPQMGTAIGSTTALSAPSTQSGYVTDILETQAEAWLNARTPAVPFFLVIAHKAPHDPWIPRSDDEGDLNAFTLTTPSVLADDRSGRSVHVQQHPNTFLSLYATWTSAPFSTCPRGPSGYCHEQPGPEVDTDPEKLAWLFQVFGRRYLETTKGLDRSVGAMLDYLDNDTVEAPGVLAAKTIICFTGDNGLLAGEHQLDGKLLPYDESGRMVLLCKGPGISAGTTQAGMVSSLDLAPTFLDIANVAQPTQMTGRSLLELLAGTAPAWRTGVYYHSQADNERGHFAYITALWKLIRWYNPSATGGPEWELIDRTSDPDEAANVYNVPANAATVATLKSAMRAAQASMGVTTTQSGVTISGVTIR